MRPGRIYASALAKHVHAAGLRHKATGRVRDAERLYDRHFPGGTCAIETARDGSLRLISPDEAICIRVEPSAAGRLFQFTE